MICFAIAAVLSCFVTTATYGALRTALIVRLRRRGASVRDLTPIYFHEYYASAPAEVRVALARHYRFIGVALKASWFSFALLAVVLASLCVV